MQAFHYEHSFNNSSLDSSSRASAAAKCLIEALIVA